MELDGRTGKPPGVTTRLGGKNLGRLHVSLERTRSIPCTMCAVQSFTSARAREEVLTPGTQKVDLPHGVVVRRSPWRQVLSSDRPSSVLASPACTALHCTALANHHQGLAGEEKARALLGMADWLQAEGFYPRAAETYSKVTCERRQNTVILFPLVL